MTENDEPLRELCFDYRNAATEHAENYFQRIVSWVKQQEVRGTFAVSESEALPERTPIALTDEEICVAWNSATADRPDAASPYLYLHYMRAIAKAQREKCGMTERGGA